MGTAYVAAEVIGLMQDYMTYPFTIIKSIKKKRDESIKRSPDDFLRAKRPKPISTHSIIEVSLYHAFFYLTQSFKNSP